MFGSTASRILLIQSEPVLAELTQFRLELLGYHIERVGSRGEATTAIDATEYDLAVVDTILPDGDGIEWIAQVRSSRTHEQLPVIVFSLDPSLETVERAFHAGANDYLITPFDPTVMEEKIEAILSKRLSVSGKGLKRERE